MPGPSFIDELNVLPLDECLGRSLGATDAEVTGVLQRLVSGQGGGRLGDLAILLSPAAGKQLEAMARVSRELTRRRFGRVVRMFAPLYVSNECINNCAYCGFSRDHAILRVTLSVEEVQREARALAAQGFRNVLLVAGEHPRFVTEGYLEACVRAVREVVPAVSLEVGPMEAEEYRPLTAAGAEGLVVYQETYDREVYGQVHTLGPKKDYDWRLATPERAYAAGFRRLGIGALHGLSGWRREALCVGAHAAWLMKHCWKAQVTVSLPRLRPCAGLFQPLTQVSDRELVQMICAFRMYLPDVGLVLSTRESAALRDGLVPLGITLISAGSHTEPGGYTGAGRENVHYTKGGRIESPSEAMRELVAQAEGTLATGQFEIADERTAAEVAGAMTRQGLEAVWKDWDPALSGEDKAVSVQT